ncbi:hypothetical protein AAFF_G00358250 [Aldrovandia affinis]|uniref:Centromere protein U n=1 Tax=Aldrovandia affinis TaxID=143900 RepID=A0AAD7T906_9TELE|nr:hypothetical protein AAFF_G00358250 [Aldrovandia affinis]
MSSKKSRMEKMLKNIQLEIQNKGGKTLQKPQNTQASLSISPIEKDSFLEDDEVLSYGNPLHSTALEDDLSPNLGRKAERSNAIPKMAGAHGSGDACAETPRRAKGQTTALLPSKSSAQKGIRPQSQRKSPGVKSRPRALRMVSERTEGEEGSGRLRTSTMAKSIPQAPEDSSTDDAPGPSQSPVSGAVESGTQKEPAASGSAGSSVSARRERLSSQSSLSSEDPTDDPSWSLHVSLLSAHERATRNWGRKRKSSSESSGSAGPSSKNKRQERDTRNPIDLDVVLDTFQDFVSQYNETVDSAPVRQAVDALSNMFEDQLIEVINNTKEFNSLKKENVKVNGTINRKRARLVEIKNELIMKEIQLRSMEKEHRQLEERLTDLRKGTTFLSDLTELHKKYRAHRQRHPKEVEVYGPSSLPALLLEARGVLGAEHQLKNINETLQQVLDQADGQ